MPEHSRYRQVLSRPGVLPVFLTAFVGRLPLGMVGLAIVLLVQRARGGYADAGLTAAVFAIASAGGALTLARLIDRLGQPRVLAPAGLVFGGALAALVAFAEDDAPLAAILAAAAVGGFALPPLSAAVRALLPGLLHSDDLMQSGYAIEAVVQEIHFLCGPLLVALLVAAISPAAAVLVAAGFGLAGAVAFTATRASQDWRAGSRRRDGRLGALGSSGLRTIAGACVCTGATFGLIEVAMPAFGEAHGSQVAAGIMLGAWSLGSMAGGLWFGARGDGRPSSRRYLLRVGAFALSLGPLALAGSIPVMAALMFVSGATIAPMFTSTYQLIGELSPPGAATEAFAVISVSIGLGIAAGAAISGSLVEGPGVTAVLLVAWSLGGAATAIALLGRRGLRAPRRAATAEAAHATS